MDYEVSTIQTPFFDISTPVKENTLENLVNYLQQNNLGNGYPAQNQVNQIHYAIRNEGESRWQSQHPDEYEGELDVGPVHAKGKCKSSGGSGSALAGVALGGTLVLATVALMASLFGGSSK